MFDPLHHPHHRRTKNTIAKLLIELGACCVKFMEETMVNLPCKRIQADEIWSFVGCKEKNVTREKVERDGMVGSVWTWTAIEADTKLIPCWLIGPRDAGTATDFIEDLANRLSNRIQLTTGGLKVYVNAVFDAFGDDIDYSVLHKIHGRDMSDASRYSPAQCIGCEKKEIIGRPDPVHVNTFYVERANLAVRMSMRRFTRVTNPFLRSLRTIQQHLHCISCGTTLGASTRR